MSDLKKFARDLGYFGVGAAAVIVETGAKAVKVLVQKGEKTLRDNQDTVDELKRRAKNAGESIKAAVDRATSQPEEPETAPVPEPQASEPQVPEVTAMPEEPASPEAPEATPVPEPQVSGPQIPEATVKPEDTING